MKKFIFSAALAMMASTSFAQNSAFYKAQELIDKNELEQAEAVLNEAIQNPKTTKLAMIYNQAGEVHSRIFNPELMKAAQGVPFDTLKFTSHLDKAIECFTKSHEADIAPDKKGKVKSKYIQQNKGRILSMMDYYNYAAMFMNANGKTAESLTYFEKYINLPKNPVFTQAETDSIYASKQQAYAQTRFNLAFLQFKEKNFDKAEQMIDEALKDTIGTKDLYVMKLQCCLEKKDSAAWLSTMKEAAIRTEAPSFNQNLLYYYVTNNKATEAEAMATEMIEKAPQSKMPWYMKGCVELNLKKNYVAARECFKKALEIDPDYIDANTNMGYTYINEIYAKRVSGEFKFVGTGKRILPAQMEAYKKELEYVKSFYVNAQPYFEHVRELAPENPRLWASSLQMIYSNLEQKEKAKEMDAFIEAGNKQ